jgi:hypothetical protein
MSSSIWCRWREDGTEDVLATGDSSSVSTPDSEEGELLIRPTAKYV